MRSLVIAHRTCPRHVAENSLEGIRLAAELGADGVEIDVRRTRDRVLVLHHDRLLWRSTRIPLPLRWVSWERLRRRRLRYGGRIVTFSEALQALPVGLLLAVDIKQGEAGEQVLEEVRAQGAESRVLLWAQDSGAVGLLAKAGPGIEVALLRDSRSRRGRRRFLEDAARLGARAISAHWAVITPAFLGAARERGLRVYAMAREAGSQGGRLELGLDGVVTDWPEEALAARAELEARGEPPQPTRGLPS